VNINQDGTWPRTQLFYRLSPCKSPDKEVEMRRRSAGMRSANDWGTSRGRFKELATCWRNATASRVMAVVWPIVLIGRVAKLNTITMLSFPDEICSDSALRRIRASQIYH
jgi:hypothetical protein